MYGADADLEFTWQFLLGQPGVSMVQMKETAVHEYFSSPLQISNRQLLTAGAFLSVGSSTSRYWFFLRTGKSDSHA